MGGDPCVGVSRTDFARKMSTKTAGQDLQHCVSNTGLYGMLLGYLVVYSRLIALESNERLTKVLRESSINEVDCLQ